MIDALVTHLKYTLLNKDKIDGAVALHLTLEYYFLLQRSHTHNNNISIFLTDFYVICEVRYH